MLFCWTLNPVWNVCFRDSRTFIDWGNDKPFLFVIDPDLDGPIHPFLVHCDFENRVSRIFHDKMFKQFINHCPTKDCYNLDITYVNSIKQIEAIISVSKSCQQLIQVSGHSVEKWKIYSHLENISSNQLFSDFFCKNIAYTKFLQKRCESKFLNFHTVNGRNFCHTVWKYKNISAIQFLCEINLSELITPKIGILPISDDLNFHLKFLHCAPEDLIMFQNFISVWLLSFTIINFWPMDGPKWSKTNLFHRYFFFKSNNFTEVFQRRTLQCESISWRLFSIYRSQIWRKNMSMWSFSAQSMFQVVKHGKRKSL